MPKTLKTIPQRPQASLIETAAISTRPLTALKIGFLVLGLYAVFSRLWAAEDAYITFRYIDNFLHGYGLVFNVGERVEGFTHPLWLFLVTLPAALGMSFRASALVISLLLTAVSLYLLIFRSRDKAGKLLLLPLAPVLLLTHTGFRDFSVSGLEFPLTCLLMVWFYQSYLQHDLLERPVLHGALLALLYLTRPELALLIASFYALLAWQVVSWQRYGNGPEARKIWSGIWRFSWPIAALAGGYHLFRWVYYDEFFPNTYFAKEGLGAYWSAGIKYFLHFWEYSPLLLVAVLGWFGLVAFNGRFRQRGLGNQRRIVMLAQAGLLFFYVTRLGGDFMGFRFLLPAMLILVLLLNDSLDYLLQMRKQRLVVSAALLAVTVLLVFVPIRTPKIDGYIADERQYYDLYHPAYLALFEEPTAHDWYQEGLELKQLQEMTNYPLVVSHTNIGYLGYAAGPEVTIVDAIGLTDKQIAHNWSAIKERGRPAHENKLTVKMAVDRGIAIYATSLKTWNRMMGTPYGSIISLDPAFIRNFPDRVARLKEYKLMVQTGMMPADETYSFLQLLEARYGILVENL